MKRKNATRSALFTSIISLLLCVSMLVGTTFAWFTDSVESGINTIAAGNLDVELYHSDKDAKDEKVAASTVLFDDVTLWEPGVVACENFVVANEGNLALKYQLAINFENETVVNGHGLSEALKVAVVEGGFTGDRAAAHKLTNLVPLESFVLSGKLEGDTKSQVYGVVIYWEPTDNDNWFNMKDVEKNEDGSAKTPLTIDLGIKLFATQEMYEEDSFGPDYDGAAAWVTLADTDWYHAEAAEYTINSAEELAGLAVLVNDGVSFAGKSVKLGSNIDLAGHEWTPIGNWNSENGIFFDGSFNGQGYTISNLYINEPTGDGVGLFGAAKNATIKGINVDNVNITGYQAVATVVGYPYTGCAISDCHVTGDISIVAEYAYAGGIFAYGYVSADNCSVIADTTGKIAAEERNAVGGIAAWMLEGDNKITNCRVKNLDMAGYGNIGGITGFIHYSNVIDNCSAENINITKTRVDGHPSVGMAAGGFSYNGSKASTISNSTFSNITFNGSAVSISSADLLWGSEYGGSTSTNFVTENIAKSSITDNLVYLSEIKTVEDLTSALSAGGKYVLKNDLAVTGTVTVPGGVEVILYMNGKTIAGTNTGTATHNDMFLVKGTLTVNGGTVTQTHAATNMGWNGCTNTFDVTAGGVLNLNGTTVENKGGTDMNFAVHMNNWGTVTLNAENAYLKATYMPVRVYNSGPDMNNVTIRNSTLEGGNHSFWVHNYGSADFGGKVYSGASAAYDKAQVDARLNLNIFGNGNTFITGKAAPVRYGFNDSVCFTAEGVQAAVAADSLIAALEAGEDVVLTNDVKIDPASMSNAYGTTGINVKQGQTIDGQGYTLDIKGAGGTWDSGINTTGGLIQNITVTGSFRGIFINHNSTYSETVVLKNVIIDGTTYTISCDQGMNQNLEAYNSTFNGWTSYAATIGTVKFDGCSFGEGNGYAFCRPYAPTEFVGCNFEAGYKLDPRAAVTFENCTIGGVALTAENLATLVTGNIANATVK